MTTPVNSESKKKERARRIKAQIVLRGLTITGLARSVGVSRQWLTRIINGDWPGEAVRRRVAKKLGVPYEELWSNNHRRAA